MRFDVMTSHTAAYRSRRDWLDAAVLFYLCTASLMRPSITSVYDAELFAHLL